MNPRPLDLSGRVALVTGAASGIGRATALALAAQGARLVLCDIDDAALAETAAALGPSCLLSRRTDVRHRDAVAALADEVHALVPALDVLVNNAGVGLYGGLLDTPLDDWDWILSINLRGVLHGCHFFVPPMVRRAQGGHVINVSSVLGYFPVGHVAGYCTSKYAVLGLTESLRAELAPHRIGVSAICPGVIDTSIIGNTRFHGTPDEPGTRARVTERYRRRGYGPDKVARAILHAIRHNPAVLPVSPEAWALYYLRRFLPSLALPLSHLLKRGLTD